jgi:anti-sigma factor RsiW
MTLTCDAVRSHLAAHVDGEATPLSPEAIVGHLAACEGCAAIVAELGAYRAAMARCYGTAPAPPALAGALRRRVRRGRSGRWWMAGVAAAALFLAAGGASLLLAISPSERFHTLADATVLHHDAFAAARAPLDLVTSDPARLVAWFTGRVPFSIQFPALDGPDLRLAGGRLIDVAGELAAYVAYRKGDAIVSLGVASAKTGTPPQGAESEAFRSHRFYLSQKRGHNVITWTDRGLAYTLVSDLPAQGRSSCVVCHGPGSGLRDVEGFHR